MAHLIIWQIKGGVARWERRRALVFANAAGLDPVNHNLTLYVSTDDGRTWPYRRQLSPLGCGYVVLQVINDTAVVFFSRNGKCGTLSVARVDLNELLPPTALALG